MNAFRQIKSNRSIVLLRKVLASCVFAVLVFTCTMALLPQNTQLAWAKDKTGSITLHSCIGPKGADETSILPSQTTPIEGTTFTIELIHKNADAYDDSEINDHLNDTPLSSFAAQSKTTGADGVVTFGDLPTGLYVVTVTTTEEWQPVQKKFAVAVPMRDENTSTSNWNVEVWPKVTSTKLILKSVEEAPVVPGVGDLLKWKIENVLPRNMKKTDAAGNTVYAHDWYIYDDLDQANDYVSASLELVNGQGDVLRTLVAGTDYTESYDAATRRVRWDIVPTTLETIANTSGAYSVDVHVTTRITEAAYGSSQYIFNNAGFSIVNANGDPIDQEVIDGDPDPDDPNQPKVKTGSVTIDKRLQGTETRLTGAHFKLATSRDNANAGVFIQCAGKDIELVTDSAGQATINGLSAGTYYFKETVAPTVTVNGESVEVVLSDAPVAVEVAGDAEKATVTATIDNPAKGSKLGFLAKTGGALHVC